MPDWEKRVEEKWEEFKFYKLPLPVGAITPKANIAIKSFISRTLEQALEKYKEEVRGIVEGIGIKRAHTYSSENADIYRAYDVGQEFMKDEVLTALSKEKKSNH